jgi:uncharacterized protein (TIGR02118 family)
MGAWSDIMYKLVILFEPMEDWEAFEELWPQFLHLAEEMPGLRREATSRVAHFLYGQPVYARVHELFFDGLEEAEAAMASGVGRQAGQLLQQISAGRMNLFLAEHKEDDMENIRKYKQKENEAD